MKTIQHYFLRLIVFLSACLSLPAFAGDKNPVPAQVQDSFKLHYPDAEAVEWKNLSDEEYEVFFALGDYEHGVIYNSSGAELKALMFLEHYHLSEDILSRISHLHSKAKIHYAAKNLHPHSHVRFIVCYEADNKMYEATFDGDMNLLNVEEHKV